MNINHNKFSGFKINWSSCMLLKLDAVDVNGVESIMFLDTYAFKLYDEYKQLIDITSQRLNDSVSNSILKHYILSESKNKISINKPHVKITNPKQLRIHLGNTCNLLCKYCNHECNNEPIHDNELTQLLGDIDGNITFDRLRRVNFCGGETLLYWNQLVEIHKFLLNKTNIDCDFIIFTNGTVFTQEKIDYLCEPSHRFRVCLSHDGIGQEYRSVDPFSNKTSFANIKQLSDRLPIGNFLISCTLNNKNCDFEKNTSFFKDIFGNRHLIFHNIPSISTEQQFNCFTNNGNQLFTSFDIVTNLMESKAPLISPLFPMVHHLLQRFGDDDYLYDPNTSHCSACNPDALVLNLDGDVLVCHSDCNTKYGHISKLNDLVTPDLWVPTKRKHCLECPVIGICAGGCVYNPSDTKYQTIECSIRHHYFFGILVYTIYLLTNKIVHTCYGFSPNKTTTSSEDRS